MTAVVDGKAADETVQFMLDGVRDEIDLSEKNSGNCVPSCSPGWPLAGEQHDAPTPRCSVGQRDDRSPRERAIREWARTGGHDFAKCGRMLVEVIHAFRAAR